MSAPRNLEYEKAMENQVASMMKIEEGDPFRKVIIKTLQENDWDVYKSM
jgi:hypothetical protein